MLVVKGKERERRRLGIRGCAKRFLSKKRHESDGMEAMFRGFCGLYLGMSVYICANYLYQRW